MVIYLKEEELGISINSTKQCSKDANVAIQFLLTSFSSQLYCLWPEALANSIRIVPFLSTASIPPSPTGFHVGLSGVICIAALDLYTPNDPVYLGWDCRPLADRLLGSEANKESMLRGPEETA